MKNFRKIASLLLVLVMALALTTAALAEEPTTTTTGTITVDNPIAGQTYTAYKIFDVVYNADKTAYSYTIQSTSAWFETVNTYAKTEGSGITLTKAVDGTTYVVTVDETKYSAPAFANALKEAVTGKSGTELAAADGKATATGLDLGYYFVTSSNGAVCNLTTTNPAVVIHDKNEITFEKTDDQESVDVGTVVNYVITSKVPDYTGYTSYTYQLTDKMSEGLTFNNDVKVYIDGTEIETNFELKTGEQAVIGENEYDFMLTIDVMKYEIGKEIEVKYSATVNEKAVAKIENNHAELTYSNNPAESSNTGKLTDEETVYSAKIVIDKYVKDSKTTKLAGAEFVLYKEVKAEDSETAIKYYYKWNDTSKKVEWTDKKEEATVKTTDESGAASFDGIADGTYYLEEIKAPKGYNMLASAVEVVVDGDKEVDGSTAVTEAKLTVTAEVANQTGTQLPSTGGMGTKILYAIGALLVIGAGVLLVTKKRMNRSENG